MVVGPPPGRQADGQHRHAAYPASSAPPYAAGDSTPLVSSTSATTQRSRFSTTRTPATAPNLSRADSSPRTRPITADSRVTAPTSSGKAPPSSPKSGSRSTHASPALAAVATSASPATRARPPRTEPSWPSAATDRATQCWTGKVTPAAAKPQ